LFGRHATAADFKAAASQIRFQRGQKDFFQDGLARSGQYLDRMKTIFTKHELPADLIYLPLVESSFNFHAYSKFGAAGIWQFTYRTGKRYMTVDYVVDQRWDPLIASDAAARLLKHNYKLLGSWPLALTAYNHGAHAMTRAQKSKGSYEQIFKEYDGRRFKFASRNFYAEFLAAREIAKNQAVYFPGLELEKPLQTETHTINGFISVRDLASQLEISLEEIRSLNLSLREPVFRDQKYVPKGFQLRLPKTVALRERLSAIPPELFKEEQKRSQFYYVRTGDVASVIARQHGITLQELIWANNLDHRARIFAGQNLRIPTPEDTRLLAARFAEPSPAEEQEEATMSLQQKTATETEPAVTSQDGIAEATPESEVNPSVVTAHIHVSRSFTKNGVLFGSIQVDTGETLGHFADWLKVSAQRIRSLNGLSIGGEIHMDQHLLIPFEHVEISAFEEKRYEFHKEFEEDFLQAYTIEGTWLYKIKNGDNIWTLCTEQFELPVWLVKKYNLSLNLNRLKPGQKIVIPIVEEKEES